MSLTGYSELKKAEVRKKQQFLQSSWPGSHQRRESDLCLRQSVKAERATSTPERKGKIRKMLLCFAFPRTCQGSNVKATAVRSPPDTRAMHGLRAIAKRHFLVRGEAWEEGTRGHGNSGTPEGRRARIGRDVESRGLKPKLKQTQESRGGPWGPRGRSHQLHLGLARAPLLSRVLNSNFFVKAAPILCFY